MTSKKNKSFQELTWEQARSKIKRVNPGLVAAIDAINPNEKHKLYSATYHYGQEIIKNGRLVTSDETSNIPDALNYYNFNPIGVVIEKNIEMYLSFKNKTMTYAKFNPGSLIDVNRIFNNSPLTNCSLWGMTAGVRSTFMLAKISEEGKHTKLKNYYSFNQPKPLSFFDEFNVFKAIANSEQLKKQWTSEVIFFSKQWFEHKEDKEWRSFNYYLLEQAWNKTTYRRDQYFLNTIASILQEEKGIKFSLSNLEQTIHLINIALGETPGFRPALNNDSLPLSQIQEAYLNVYGLDYAPIIMEPSYFDAYNENETPIYYSLNYPSSIYFSPKESKKTSTIYDIYELGRMLKKYLDEIANRNLGLKETPLYYIAKNCSFTQHYAEAADEYSNILTPDIIAKDIDFNSFAKEKLKFPKSSSFFNGCIRISRKTQQVKA